MPIHPIETEVKALKTGYVSFDEDASVSYLFAVFTQDDALHAVEQGCDDVATALTGWHPSYRGPGRSFSEEPMARVFGKKVLVTQRCGVDI